MTTTDKVAVARHCLNGLESAGFSVWETAQFEKAVDTLRGLGKSYLTPNMSPFMNDFTADNCFWLMLNHNDTPIGGIAARRDNLGTESLTSFWRRAMRRQYGQGTKDQVGRVSKTIESEVSGRVTYFGDLIVEKSFRGKGDHLRFFTMYAQMVAALMWDSDWVYAFISEQRAESGGAYTYGFTRVIPGAQEWFDAPKTRSSSECCVLSSRTELNDIAAYFARSPDKLRVVKDTD